MTGRSWFHIPESGTLAGMRFLVTVYRFGGGWLFRACLFPVMLYYFATRREARRASRDYLQRVARREPGLLKPGLWTSFRHFWQFGLSLLDKLCVWMGDIGRDDVVLHNPELIDEMIADGRGGVLLLSHLGNFEICHALSETRPGLRLTVLHHTRHAARFNRLLNRYNGHSRVTLQQVSEVDMGTAISMSEKIGRGEFVAIAADRVPVANPEAVRTLEFLGAPAPFPTGPFVLAMALEVPIITIHCLWREGRHHIYFEQLGRGEHVGRRQREAALTGLMNTYVERLEHYCRLAPLQWYNFYAFWSDDSESVDRSSRIPRQAANGEL